MHCTPSSVSCRMSNRDAHSFHDGSGQWTTHFEMHHVRHESEDADMCRAFSLSVPVEPNTLPSFHWDSPIPASMLHDLRARGRHPFLSSPTDLKQKHVGHYDHPNLSRRSYFVTHRGLMDSLSSEPLIFQLQRIFFMPSMTSTPQRLDSLASGKPATRFQRCCSHLYSGLGCTCNVLLDHCFR